MGFSSIPRVSYKFLGWNGYNPTRHSFVLIDQFQWGFQINCYCLTENAHGRKMFAKICPKAIRDTYFPIFGLWSGEGQEELIFWRSDIQKNVKVSNCWLAGRPHSQFPPLLRNTDLLIRKTLRMILKKVREVILFQIHFKFIASKVKDEKEVANPLMSFNLLKIIHSFQDKHLRI